MPAKKRRSPVILSIEQAQERMREKAAKQVDELGRLAIETFKQVAKAGDETRSRVPAAAHLAQIAGLIGKGATTVKAKAGQDGKMEVVVSYVKAPPPEEDD